MRAVALINILILLFIGIIVLSRANMNHKLTSLFVIAILLFGCEDDGFNKNQLIHSEGLNLWWNHKIFGEKGRGYIFSFSETERLENKYKLSFEYEIDNRRKRIDIYLTGKTDKGKCPYFPTPNKTDNLCISNGDFFIPENNLIEADYRFTLRTADFTAESILSVTKNKVTLKIPENEYFSSFIKEVFPAPKNLLYGNVIFEGSEKTKFALEYFEKLKILGLRDTTVANPPFNLFVDENGKPKDEYWDPDKLGSHDILVGNKFSSINFRKSEQEKRDISYSSLSSSKSFYFSVK